jgi:heparin binding hemagglutinin HbhA
MTETTKNKIPGPLYAAAGAGDLAYQQLRKLPAVLNELSGKAATSRTELRERGAELRERAAASSTELRERARSAAAQLRTNRPATGELDIERLRETARRNMAAFVASAQAAQEKATAVYEDLVARGAQVVGHSAGTLTADAEIESEGAAGAVESAEKPALPPGRKATKATKATKRTRPAAEK